MPTPLERLNAIELATPPRANVGQDMLRDLVAGIGASLSQGYGGFDVVTPLARRQEQRQRERLIDGLAVNRQNLNIRNVQHNAKLNEDRNNALNALTNLQTEGVKTRNQADETGLAVGLELLKNGDIERGIAAMQGTLRPATRVNVNTSAADRIKGRIKNDPVLNHLNQTGGDVLAHEIALAEDSNENVETLKRTEPDVYNKIRGKYTPQHKKARETSFDYYRALAIANSRVTDEGKKIIGPHPRQEGVQVILDEKKQDEYINYIRNHLGEEWLLKFKDADPAGYTAFIEGLALTNHHKTPEEIMKMLFVKTFKELEEKTKNDRLNRSERKHSEKGALSREELTGELIQKIRQGSITPQEARKIRRQRELDD